MKNIKLIDEINVFSIWKRKQRSKLSALNIDSDGKPVWNKITKREGPFLRINRIPMNKQTLMNK